MEAHTITCPNCGANTTNHQNCEYCGSVLVRFIDQKVEIDNDWYNKDAPVISGLIEKLQQNLQLQESTPGVLVCTDIDEPSGRVNLQFANCMQDEVISAKKLVVFLRMLSEEYAIFKQLPISKLFTCTFCNDTGYWECCIDFGIDYETAARMISHISREVYGISNFSNFKIKTWADSNNQNNSGCFGLFLAICTISVSALSGIGYAIYNAFA